MKQNCGLGTVAMVGVLLATGWVGVAGGTNTQNTISAPAGFVRIVLSPQTNVFAAMPFVAADLGIAAVFSNSSLSGATNESAADKIQKWDSAAQVYEDAFKYTDGTWRADLSSSFATSALTFYPGDGFIIHNRDAAVSKTVFLCGSVVLTGGNPKNISSGMSLFGYQYSTAHRLNDTSLAADGAQAASSYTNSDQVSTWDSIQS